MVLLLLVVTLFSLFFVYKYIISYGLSVQYIQYAGENNTAHSTVQIEHFNRLGFRFSGHQEFQLGQLKDFGTILTRSELFVIGGKEGDQFSKSVRMKSQISWGGKHTNF